MGMNSSAFLIGFLALAASCCALVDYSGHQVLRLKVETLEEAALLAGMREDYDFWTEIGVGRSVDILCGPDQVENLTEELSRHGVQFSTMIEDVQKLAEMAPMTKGTKNKSGHNMDWTAYHPIEDMHIYLDYLETTFDFVTTESLGKSYEGSDMRVAKVCKGGCGARQDLLTEEVVMVLMLTVTGDSIWAQEGPPVILAQTPIWDQNHSQRWRTGM